MVGPCANADEDEACDCELRVRMGDPENCCWASWFGSAVDGDIRWAPRGRGWGGRTRSSGLCQRIVDLDVAIAFWRGRLWICETKYVRHTMRAHEVCVVCL